MLQVTTSCRKEGSRSQRPSSACGSKGSLPLCRRRSNIRGAGMVVWGTRSWDNAASSVIIEKAIEKRWKSIGNLPKQRNDLLSWWVFHGCSILFYIVLVVYWRVTSSVAQSNPKKNDAEEWYIQSQQSGKLLPHLLGGYCYF